MISFTQFLFCPCSRDDKRIDAYDSDSSMSIVSLFTFSSFLSKRIFSNGVRPINIDVVCCRRMDVVTTLPRECDLVG